MSRAPWRRPVDPQTWSALAAAVTRLERQFQWLSALGLIGLGLASGLALAVWTTPGHTWGDQLFSGVVVLTMGVLYAWTRHDLARLRAARSLARRHRNGGGR